MSLFYLAIFFILYIHFLYPLILLVTAAIRKKNKRSNEQNIIQGKLPSVTLLIAAFNEEAVIEEKINNSLALRYPRELLEIIIVSDGSTDATDVKVKKYHNKNIELLRVEGRLGKTMCQNLAAKSASGQVIVYSDATSMYHSDAILHLVRRFEDDDVGCVIGRIGTEVELHKASVAQEESLYLRFSQWVKNLEGFASMPVGASGAIFAIVKHLAVELPGMANDDLLRPLSVIQQGYRAVYEPKAVAWEKYGENYDEILQKKIRIAKRAVFSLSFCRSLLNPCKFGLFSLQFLTKTLLRRLLLPHYIVLFLSSIYLVIATDGIIYFLCLIGMLLILVLAAVGYLFRKSRGDHVNVFLKMAKFCYYYLLVISGAFWGILLGISGREIVGWQPKR